MTVDATHGRKDWKRRQRGAVRANHGPEVVKREDAVESRASGFVGEGECVVGVVAKRRKQRAVFHSPANATRVAPIAPDRGPKSDVVTVMVGRASCPSTRHTQILTCRG